MRGVLLTELIEMMEDLMGLEFTNKVIEDACLENEGAYTAVGNYPDQDLFRLLEALSRHAKNPQHKVIKSYGEYLFFRSCFIFPEEISKHQGTFSLLQEIPTILDREIRKLEPDAPLPDIRIEFSHPNFMVLIFNAEKRMNLLLEGIIRASISYYQEPVSITRNDLDAEGTTGRFVLQKISGHERN